MLETLGVQALFEDELTVRRRLGVCPSFFAYDVEREGRPGVLAVLPVDCSHPDRAALFEVRARMLRHGFEHRAFAAPYLHGVQDGVPWVEYEPADARLLGEQLALSPVGRQRAVTIVLELLEALGALHADRRTHGNLTPDAVLLAHDWTGRRPTRLLGAGLAAIVHELGGTRFRPVDPRRYVAPEVAAGHEWDGRADIYSVGALLYHMLADEPPPLPPAVATFCGDPRLPRELETIFRKSLAVDPFDRYWCAEEMMAEVRAISADRRSSSRPVFAADEPDEPAGFGAA